MDRLSLREWIANPYALLPAKEHMLEIADALVRAREAPLAASVVDRLWSRFPLDEIVTKRRREILDSLAKIQHNLTFRYVPEGGFVMGSEDGDDDERPTRILQVGAFWIADAPLTSADCEDIDKLPLPTPAAPAATNRIGGSLRDRIHFRYSRGPAIDYSKFNSVEAVERAMRLAGALPAVALSYTAAETFVARLSGENLGQFAIPSEVQWEKAARGGLHAEPYPWGSSEPSARLCDFDRFNEFSIRSPREFQPNGYGLYGIAGTVFEWCSTIYDALAYAETPVPPDTANAKPMQVIRGGSWADCAYACRVSFRAAHDPTDGYNPNIGLRPVMLR